MILDRLGAMNPILVGIQVFSVDFPAFCELLKKIRRWFPEVATVAGGPHPSGMPELTLKRNPDLDFVVQGEGEPALPMLVEALLAGHTVRGPEANPSACLQTSPTSSSGPVRASSSIDTSTPI